MTRLLTIDDILFLHAATLTAHGGQDGIHDYDVLKSAIAQLRLTNDDDEVYPTLFRKVMAISFLLICKHGFVNGNKRVGFAAAIVMLRINGWILKCTPDEGMEITQEIASGQRSREEWHQWLMGHSHGAESRLDTSQSHRE